VSIRAKPPPRITTSVSGLHGATRVGRVGPGVAVEVVVPELLVLAQALDVQPVLALRASPLASSTP